MTQKILFFELVNAISFVQMIAGLDVSEVLSGEFEFMSISEIGRRSTFTSAKVTAVGKLGNF